MYSSTISSTTPGIPNVPAITAVSGFITMLKPIKLPIKFTINNKIPPKTPFIINLIINLIGITNMSPRMYNKKRPNIKANRTPMSIRIPPFNIHYYIIRDRVYKYYLFPISFALFKK